MNGHQRRTTGKVLCPYCQEDFSDCGTPCQGGPNTCGGCSSCMLSQHIFYRHSSPIDKGPTNRLGLRTPFVPEHRRFLSRFLIPKATSCPFCQDGIVAFRDPISIQEFKISGLCQECQDKTFHEPEHALTVGDLMARAGD